MNELPTTLIGAVRYFSDLDICDEYMKRMRTIIVKLPPITPKAAFLICNM